MPQLRTLLRTFLIGLLVPAGAALAQENPTKAAAAAAPDNPYSAHARMMYGGVKSFLVRAAEKMPEENYNFRPTEAVRTFGQIVGHVADAQHMFCSMVLGEKPPETKIELTKTSKADLVAALKGAVAYCDRAYDGMTDAAGVPTVKVFGREIPKLGVLDVNSLHSMEHYGNLVVYLRIKNIVPPSSEPGSPGAKPAEKK